MLEVKTQSATQTHTSLSLTVCLFPALPQPFSNQISCSLLSRNMCQRNQQLGYNCYQLIMLTFYGIHGFFITGTKWLQAASLHTFCRLSTFNTWPRHSKSLFLTTPQFIIPWFCMDQMHTFALLTCQGFQLHSSPKHNCSIPICVRTKQGSVRQEIIQETCLFFFFSPPSCFECWRKVNCWP